MEGEKDIKPRLHGDIFLSLLIKICGGYEESMKRV
jgi:hypothetical protein